MRIRIDQKLEQGLGQKWGRGRERLCTSISWSGFVVRWVASGRTSGRIQDPREPEMEEEGTLEGEREGRVVLGPLVRPSCRRSCRVLEIRRRLAILQRVQALLVTTIHRAVGSGVGSVLVATSTSRKSQMRRPLLRRTARVEVALQAARDGLGAAGVVELPQICAPPPSPMR